MAFKFTFKSLTVANGSHIFKIAGNISNPKTSNWNTSYCEAKLKVLRDYYLSVFNSKTVDLNKINNLDMLIFNTTIILTKILYALIYILLIIFFM